MLKLPRSKAALVSMEREGKNNTQVWISWVDGEKVISQWGIKEGKMQQTIDIPGPKGKEGTKAFIDPERSALNTLIRDVKKKAQKGYEIVDGPTNREFKKALATEIGGVTKTTKITFDGPIPDNVSFSKPVNSVDPKKLMKLQARESKEVGGPPLVWTLKKNGMCYLVSKDKAGDVWIQSRGKLIVENEKFPHLVEQFNEFLPPESLLLCEFFLGDGNTKRDFSAMQQVANSLPERALSMQRELGLVQAYIFRVPFWESENMEAGKANTVWLDLILQLSDGWDDQASILELDHLHALVISDDSYEEAVAEMYKHGYEGWVVYDCYGSLGDKHISFQGQPDRPRVCWKVKRSLEDDFLGAWNPNGIDNHCTSKCHVDLGPWLKPDQDDYLSCPGCGKKMKTDGTWGTGKNKERVGTLSLYQYDQHGGLIYICEVSSGLTDQQKQEIADEGYFYGVVQIGFQDRTFVTQGDDSNALTHPKVISFRGDKEPRECTSEEL